MSASRREFHIFVVDAADNNLPTTQGNGIEVDGLRILPPIRYTPEADITNRWRYLLLVQDRSLVVFIHDEQMTAEYPPLPKMPQIIGEEQEHTGLFPPDIGEIRRKVHLLLPSREPHLISGGPFDAVSVYYPDEPDTQAPVTFTLNGRQTYQVWPPIRDLQQLNEQNTLLQPPAVIVFS